MRFIIKKINIVLFLFIFLSIKTTTEARDSKIQYTRENISNYFLGMVSINQAYNKQAFKHLKKLEAIKNKHSQFNVEYIRTLVLLGKFKEAFAFSKKVTDEDELFFETDLLLGLNFFLNKDYKTAEKYFERLNNISRYNLFFDNFIGNVLIAWLKASEDKQEESFKFIKKIQKPYRHLKNTQNIFLQCYFDDNDTQKSLENLIESKEYNFSRYNFFLINYLLFNNKIEQAKKVIEDSRRKHSSNLLIKQTEIRNS